MRDTQPSPRTPILYEHWNSEGDFAYSHAFNGSATSHVLVTAEDLHTPVAGREQHFVIIPLHSPSKKPEFSSEHVKRATGSQSSPSSYFSPPVNRIESGTQPHRRSPEKRFSSPGPICRICHEGDKDECLLSPCNCSGSMQLVHKSCLEKWLSTSNSEHCELCMKKLPVHKVARPIWQWFSMSGTADGPQGFYADLTCVLLLTPLCILSIYLCAIGAADYMKHGVWEGTGLAALSCFLLGTYVVWCYITIRFHWQTARKWRTSNQVIHLLDKDCKRRDTLSSRVSDSSTPRGTLIISHGWNSPPEIRLFSLQNGRPETQGSPVGNLPNVMDSSIRGHSAPAFL